MEKHIKNVIEWFRNIENKQAKKFCMFGIKDLYPSIKESILRNALLFAKQQTKVLTKEFETIVHSRRSLLYNKGELRRKISISM